MAWGHLTVLFIFHSFFLSFYLFVAVQETNVWDYVQDRLKSNFPLSTLEATHIFSQLCHALHAMHSIGPTTALSHRDVKPQNILLSTKKSPPPELLVEGSRDEDDAAHLIVSTSALMQQKQQRLPHAVLMDFGSVAPAEVQITSRIDALATQEDAEVHYFTVWVK
jgi:serine/threonine protein kinase